MGGGLMQLVAYGAQDVYLTGNPQITFFKVVYRRHTNFSMEAIEQTWNGSSTTNGRCTATLSRNGDLVHRLYIDVSGTIGARGGGVDTQSCNPGSEFINSVELEIGGQRIDKHSGVFMEAYAELTQPNYSNLVEIIKAANETGDGTLFQNMSCMGGCYGDTEIINPMIPLQFWFCRNPGLALPLIALQYHEVKVILDHVIDTTFNDVTHNKLWADYIYLDTDERRRFAQVSHEYLIEQVQEQSLEATTGAQDLNFNHPVKELIWTSCKGVRGSNTQTALDKVSAKLTDTFQLKLNGHDRFAARVYKYFSRVQVWEHHSGHGGIDSTVRQDEGGSNDSICVYSFALKPEEHQPSGTCNFSRIDNAQLVSSGTIPVNSVIFAINYNVLRIMSGMGGLAYSN